MRLIDADALKAELLGKIAFPEWVREAVLHIIDNAPTEKSYQEGHIDGVLQAEKLYARPIGEWIEESSEVGAMNIKYTGHRCSNCGFEYRLVISKNFCPNCGADMRGKENEE